MLLRANVIRLLFHNPGVVGIGGLLSVLMITLSAEVTVRHFVMDSCLSVYSYIYKLIGFAGLVSAKGAESNQKRKRNSREKFRLVEIVLRSICVLYPLKLH